MKPLLTDEAPWLEPRYQGTTPFSRLHHGTRRTPIPFSCSRGHEVLVRDSRRVSSLNHLDSLCRECARENMLFSNRFPERAAMWLEENSIAVNELRPSMNSPRSFLCPHGHSFQRNPWARVRGGEFCSQCSSRGNFIDYYGEEIAALWDGERNGCSPEEFPGGRNTLVHFLCPRGHSFSRFPQGMQSTRGNHCPECRERERVEAFPSRELLLSLWDYERNCVHPSLVSGKSRERIWLLCPEGHSYQSQLRSLLSMGGCKFCLGAASSMEQEVKVFLESHGRGAIFSTAVRGVLPGRLELDLFSRENSMAVEVNGDYWHSDGVIASRGRFPDGVSYHGAKLRAAGALNISLIFLWEHHWREHGEIAQRAVATWLSTGEVDPMLEVLTSPLDAPCSLCHG